MRQRKWIKYLEDYDCTINYYPSKANVVVDPLSRKVKIVMFSIEEWELLEHVGDWKLIKNKKGITCANIRIQTELYNRIRDV